MVMTHTLHASPGLHELGTPFAKPGYRPDVQGLRAAAVTLVVLYHAGFGFPGGFVGVDAFFVLSGFVITRRLRWEVANTGQVDIRGFLRRRVVRILPAASAATVVALLGTVLLAPLSGRDEGVTTAFSAILFNANTSLAMGASETGGYFEQTTSLNPFLHMWSLSVEEQFYLVFPLLLLGAAAFARRRGLPADSAIIRLVNAVMIVSFVASLIAIDRNQTFAFYLAPFRAWEFLVGAAIVWVERIHWQRLIALAISFLGGSLLLWAALGFHEGGSFPGFLALVPVAGTALLVVGGSGEQSQIQRGLSHRVPGLVGRVSYAWYLWHWPLIVFAKASFGGTTVAVLVSVVASLFLAALSTLYFEEPIRNRKWSGRSAARLAFWCIGLSLLTGVGALVLVQLTNQSASMEEFSESFRQAGPAGRKCLAVQDPADICTNTVDAPSGKILLLGDSTAWQLYPGMIKAAESLSHDLSMATLRGCPTDGVEIRLFGHLRDADCPVFWDSVMKDLESDPPEAVVVALATDWYINYSSNEVIDPSGEFVADPRRRRELLGPALLKTINDLTDRVDHVVFVGATPKFGDWYPADCSFGAWKFAPGNCGITRSWEDIDAERGGAVELEAEIVRQTGAHFIGLDDVLCDEDGCSTHRGDQWVFRDYGHITNDESERLAPILASAIARNQ